MSSILIVEDDSSIHDVLEEMLKVEYQTFHAYSGTEALLLLEKEKIDLILLDLMLPGLTGEEIIDKVNRFPIIVLSAKINVSDKANCLLKGASDYMTKPFNKEELLARIKVQLRNTNNKGGILEYKELKLMPDYHTLYIGDDKISLTKTEYAIMKQLLLNPRNSVPKSTFLDLISQDTPDCDEDSLRVHISNIRKKIKKITNTQYIESVWGIGFKLYE